MALGSGPTFGPLKMAVPVLGLCCRDSLEESAVMGAIPAVREQLQFPPTHAALLFPWPGGTSQTFISCFFQMEGMICEFHFSIASLSLQMPHCSSEKPDSFVAWRFLSPKIPGCCSSVPPAVKSWDTDTAMSSVTL